MTPRFSCQHLRAVPVVLSSSGALPLPPHPPPPERGFAGVGIGPWGGLRGPELGRRVAGREARKRVSNYSPWKRPLGPEGKWGKFSD